MAHINYAESPENHFPIKLSALSPEIIDVCGIVLITNASIDFVSYGYVIPLQASKEIGKDLLQSQECQALERRLKADYDTYQNRGDISFADAFSDVRIIWEAPNEKLESGILLVRAEGDKKLNPDLQVRYSGVDGGDRAVKKILSNLLGWTLGRSCLCQRGQCDSLVDRASSAATYQQLAATFGNMMHIVCCNHW